jgi:F-type H+-transporting ATPase subunit b
MRRFGTLVAVYAICLGTPALLLAQEDDTHAAAEQHAEEHEKPGIQNWWDWNRRTPPPFGFAIVNFLIFLAIMGKLAGPGIKSMVRGRHDTIARDLREAAELRRQAEAELKQYQAKVANIDQEIETLLALIKKEAELEKARIIATAEADAKRLKLDAERQIAAEIDRARRELRRGVIEAAIAAADEVLKKNIGADDQRKMAEHYVAEVEQHAKQGRPS